MFIFFSPFVLRLLKIITWLTFCHRLRRLVCRPESPGNREGTQPDSTDEAAQLNTSFGQIYIWRTRRRHTNITIKQYTNLNKKFLGAIYLSKKNLHYVNYIRVKIHSVFRFQALCSQMILSQKKKKRKKVKSISKKKLFGQTEVVHFKT